MSTTNPKYRPSLPPHLIAHILDLAKKEQPLSTSSIELISILAPFQAKIQNMGLEPAYTTQVRLPKPSIEVSLGMAPCDAIAWKLFNEETHQYKAYYTKEEFWEACYLKSLEYPESLHLLEMNAAKEHMYLNDLMTEEEVIEFELETK